MVLRIVAMAIAPIFLVFLVFGPLSARVPQGAQTLHWAKPVKGAPSQVSAKLEDLDLAEAIGPGVEVEVEKEKERVQWVAKVAGRHAMTFTAELDAYSRRRTDLRALISRGDVDPDTLPESLQTDAAAYTMFTGALMEHLHGFSPPKLSDVPGASSYGSASSYSSSGYAYAPKPGEPMLDPTPSRY